MTAATPRTTEEQWALYADTLQAAVRAERAAPQRWVRPALQMATRSIPT